MFTSENLIADYPAYSIHTMPEWKRNKLAHGQVFALPFETARYGTQYRFFTLGSIFGYAVENGDDVLATYERAKERGHKLHWANANSVSITSHKRDKEQVWALEWGAVITFEGKRFKLVKAPNDNVSLIEAE